MVSEDFAWINEYGKYNVTDFRERPLGFVSKPDLLSIVFKHVDSDLSKILTNW